MGVYMLGGTYNALAEMLSTSKLHKHTIDLATLATCPASTSCWHQMKPSPSGMQRGAALVCRPAGGGR
jgi:hypothetical protein